MSQDPLTKVVVTFTNEADRVLERFGRDEALRGLEVVICDDRHEILSQIVNADVAYVGAFDAEMLGAARRLRWVHALSGGVEVYLFPEMVASPVALTCVKSTFATVGCEFAIAGMLMFSRRLNHAIGPRALSLHDDCRDDELHPEDLSGKTAGVIGLGNIGKAIACGARCMGMRVAALVRTSRAVPDQVDSLYTGEQMGAFLGQCDYVMTAIPVTDQTRGMINERALRQMKRTAYLIDCSGRPSLYEFTALVRAVEEQWIAGVCFQPSGPGGPSEIPPTDSPFWQRPNVIVSPCRGTSAEQEDDCRDLFFENLRRYRAGEPLRDLVDKRAGY